MRHTCTMSLPLVLLAVTQVWADYISMEPRPVISFFYNYDGGRLAGSRSSFLVGSAYDQDTYHFDSGGTALLDDEVQDPSWKATAGSFPFGNRGSAAIWQAPDSEDLDIRLEATVEDVPAPGMADDTYRPWPAVAYLKSLIPYVDTVSFAGDHAINGVSDPVYIWTGKNEPVSYTKGKWLIVGGTYSHYDDLWTSGIAEVLVYDSRLGECTSDTSVIFTADHCQGSSWHLSDPLPNEIGQWSHDLIWMMRVPDGSNEWMLMQDGVTRDHTIYTVYGSRKCTQSNYTKGHLAYATNWGSGGVAVTENDIPHRVQHAVPVNFAWQTLSDPWDIVDLGLGGDCITHARLMAEALKVLGVDADTAYVGEERFCLLHMQYEWHCFLETGALAVPTNFEGVCSVELRDQEGTPTWYYDVAMQEVNGDMQKGNHTNMWTEWHSLPPPHHKVIFAYQYWENHEGY